MISSTLTVTNSNDKVVAQFNDCVGTSVDLAVGTYHYDFDVTITGPLALNDTMMKEIKLEIASFQPLLVWNLSLIHISEPTRPY